MMFLHLENYKQTKPYVWNCRCHICGDSKTRKHVSRMFFYVKKGQLFVCCKNCGYSRSFYNYMKEKQPALFEEYKKKTLLASIDPSKTKQDSSKSILNDTPSIVVLPKLESAYNLVDLAVHLDDNHPAIKYLHSRNITGDLIKRFWYAENFYKLACVIDKSLHDCDESKQILMSKPRLIIPFISDDGSKIEMIQGRSLDPKDKLRYISIKSNNDVEKLYGKNEIDYSNPIKVVEGPIDSIFVNNCLATCDSDLLRAKADIYIWDNEPRNKEIVNHIDKAIELNKSVVIWPTSPEEKQDINDLILMGVDRTLLNDIIEQRTFNGLKAKLEFNKWKRV